MKHDWKLQGWSDSDVKQGEVWFLNLLVVLTAKGYPVIPFPLWHPKFLEVLRAVANALELMN